MVFFFAFLAPAFGLSRGWTKALFGWTGAGFSVSGGRCAGTPWATWGFGSGAGAGAGVLTGGGAAGVALVGTGGVLELAAGTSTGGAAGTGLGAAAGETKIHSQLRFFIWSIQV